MCDEQGCYRSRCSKEQQSWIRGGPVIIIISEAIVSYAGFTLPRFQCQYKIDLIYIYIYISCERARHALHRSVLVLVRAYFVFNVYFFFNVESY